jgi:predicted dehydrogenase
VAAHPDLAHLLGASAVDAVVLASPAAAHVDDAALATGAGVAVLVEKPPAPDAAGAAALADLRPAPWVGFNRRFDPGNQALRARVPEHGPLQLDLVIHYRRRSWRPVAVHDDATLDLGPHAVDLASWLARSPVVEVGAATVAPTRVELRLRLGRGWARVRLATDRPHRERFVVLDDRGRARARHDLGGLAAAARGRLRPSALPSALVRSLAGQLVVFAAAARGEPSPTLGTAADGLAAMEVLDTVRARAARRGSMTAEARTRS